MFGFLRDHGLLGLNARSLLYIRPFNPKRTMALADDKLKTKSFLSARDIPVPKIYGKIFSREELYEFDFNKLPDRCVLKPNFGFGGEGIIILERKNGYFTQKGKELITAQELKEHIEDIIDGKYSIDGRRDIAFFEQVLTAHDSLARFRPAGLPDIRVIVFNLVPVMAMLRIPTAASDGKANVHLGGIGIGIDISKGLTTHAAQYNKIIKTLPHGGSPGGMQIPNWEEILLICSKIQYVTNIGFLAVDITLDQQVGPTVIEVNARAGLMVQLANLAPLRSRLERVEGLKVSSPEKGVRIGQDLFGERVEKEEEEPLKPVLGSHEIITIAGDGEAIEVPALLNPGQEKTIFAPALAKKLMSKKAIELADKEEQTYRAKFTLGDKKIQTLINVEPIEGHKEKVLIGSRDLIGFLIDPAKKLGPGKRKTSIKSDLRAVDRLLSQLDQELLLLKHLKPANLEGERKRMRTDRQHNPSFIYADIPLDLDDAKKRLSEPVVDSSPLGVLLDKKRLELLKRIELLEHRGGDPKRFTQSSRSLYGVPTVSLIKYAQKTLNERPACDLPTPDKELFPAEAIAKRFDEALARYSLHEWSTVIRPNMMSDVSIGGNHVYIRGEALLSEAHISALIAHEVETHILCAENGNHQGFRIFRRGFANYLDTQEGLATLNQNYHLSQYDERRFYAPRNVLGLAFALKHSCSETRNYLEEEMGYQSEKAITQALSFKRGLSDTSQSGAFTKSVVYLRGLKAVRRFYKQGGDMRDLYLGRVAIEDIELIKQIPDLEPAHLIPRWLIEKEDEKNGK